MKPSLASHFHSRPVEERNRVQESDLEAQFFRQRGLLAKPRCLVLDRRSERAEFVSGHPRPITVNRFIRDDRVDFGNRRQPSVPDGLGVIASKILHETSQIAIRDAGDVRRRVARVDTAGPLAIDDRDALAGAFQKISGGQTRDAAADDGNVDRHIAVERAEPRHLRRIVPVGFNVELSRRWLCFHAALPCRSLRRSICSRDFVGSVENKQAASQRSNG